ncbi:Xaa-Pro aminopeptidase [hydrothermal vent metagenome]|uniref:Xaa-Pro aminopeptidase n=1 Tax=hydrothermal vent metagenome TaxID=652676 RepID=A0A3B0R9F9_9ZZZZ
MIQDFTVKGGPQIGRANLPRLRARLLALDLAGMIIPHEDEYQNEYLPANADRLGWVSGFTGSAGAAIVMQDQAVMLTDGRYTLQVREQVDGELFEFADLLQPGVNGWLASHTSPGQRIGYDPRLVSPDMLARWQIAASKSGATLISLPQNPIDQAWQDRPPAPKAAIHPQPMQFSGQAHGEKIAQIADRLTQQNAASTIITAPASIAWLFNIRGGDVACTPLPLSTALVRADGTASLFVDTDKITDETRRHLGNSVTILPENQLDAAIAEMSSTCVSLDPASASAWVFAAADAAGAIIRKATDPCLLPKACKNPVEVEGARIAHRRDGLALSRFLHWLDSPDVQNGGVDEIIAAQKLESFRQDTGALKDLSFESISGAGPNGAIVHYRATTASNRALETNSLFLIDSGGQYTEGTTDVTRTVAIGTPNDEMRGCFTRVLKGHIALAKIRFPAGTTGTHLDALARMYLWEAGLDYDHGTGHGVGSFLGVHEGPQRIARAWNDTALQPGMIVSNEPGFYKEGAFGIRIENLQVVTSAETIPGGERPMLGFESLTLAPIDLNLVVPALLNADEIAWLDAYHAKVRQTHLPNLSQQAAIWMHHATRKVAQI